jgi:hypothetical protein
MLVSDKSKFNNVVQDGRGYLKQTYLKTLG